MAGDRITRVEIEGLRSIDKLALDLDGLRVLIGESGSGKSSIVEAFAILRSIPDSDFVRRLHAVHGGPHALVSGRSGGALRMSVWAAPSHPPDGAFEGIRYDLSLSGVAGTFSVESERLRRTPVDAPDVEGLPVLERVAATYRGLDAVSVAGSPQGIAQDQLALALHSRQGSASARRMLETLERIDVQLPFDTMASWAARSGVGRRVAMRTSQTLEPARRVELLGENLPSVYHALKNDPDGTQWSDVLTVLRLGLGPDLDDVVVSAEASSSIRLFVKYAATKPVPASALSDGSLSYLAFTAMRFLGVERSILVFDEPDLHLHPHLLFRMLDILRDMTTRHPVLLTTHSERLLDALEDPAAETLLLELDGRRSTRVRRPDARALARWLEAYRGIGQLRAEGYEDAVFERPPDGDGPA